MLKGICYNASRQERRKVLIVARKKPRSCDLRGFSIPLWQGGLCLRLATAYLSPSSHLQM